MKPRVFFVDEDSSSRHNGIGTFRRMILKSLSEILPNNVNLISLNAQVTELTRSRSVHGIHYSVPRISNSPFRESGPLLWPLLSLYIRDSRHNVFMFNHSPCSDFIASFKDIFPESRSVFIIHDQGWNASLMGNSVLLRRIVVDNELPDSVSEYTADYVRDYCKEERKIYQLVDKVVCLCESTRDLLTDVYGLTPDRYELIPNGYECDSNIPMRDRDQLRMELGIGAEVEIAIFAARSVKHKGIVAILKTAALLRSLRPSVRCVIATRMDSASQFNDLINPAATSLIFTGHLGPDELRKWYLAADVGVMSSYTEQCSYSAMEMMDAGLSIVSSDGHGLRDMFSDQENAFVAKIGDVVNDESYVDALANAIVASFTVGKETKVRMKGKNFHLLSTRYSLNNMTENYSRLFNSIIGCNRNDD